MRYQLTILASIIAIPLAGQAPLPVAKTAPGATVKTWTTPRTPDGQPDLQGIWNNSTLTPLERPRDLAGKEFFTEQELAAYEKRQLDQVNADRRSGTAEADLNRSYNESWWERGKLLLRTSLIVDPPDGRIPPLTADGQKLAAALAEDRRKRGPQLADSWEDRNLAERCITRGAPKLGGGYNNNFLILQTPGYVTILQEMIHEVRIIPLDGRPHLDKNVKLWMGDSRGHWEGDTLVVDTTNYDGRIIANSFNCCGLAGANLHMTERFRRISADAIDYRYTVDDPVIYTKPWTVVVPMAKAPGPMYEYACHEGNYSMIGILSAGRAEEKAKEDAARR